MCSAPHSSRTRPTTAHRLGFTCGCWTWPSRTVTGRRRMSRPPCLNLKVEIEALLNRVDANPRRRQPYSGAQHIDRVGRLKRKIAVSIAARINHNGYRYDADERLLDQ